MLTKNCYTNWADLVTSKMLNNEKTTLCTAIALSTAYQLAFKPLLKNIQKSNSTLNTTERINENFTKCSKEKTFTLLNILANAALATGSFYSLLKFLSDNG